MIKSFFEHISNIIVCVVTFISLLFAFLLIEVLLYNFVFPDRHSISGGWAILIVFSPFVLSALCTTKIQKKRKLKKCVSVVSYPVAYPKSKTEYATTEYNRCSAIKNDSFKEYGGADATLLSIDLMDGHDFERWCAEALCNSGFTNVNVTPGSGDQGVDVLAVKDGVKYAVQCKCYSSNLGNSPIQEVNAGKTFYNCHVGAVMTNRYFTKGAQDLANATGTLLWDRNWIISYLSKNKQTHTTGISEFEISPLLISAAVDVILETGQASVSMIERRLHTGYAQSARIIDELERRGFIGPFTRNAPRKILITQEQWKRMK